MSREKTGARKVVSRVRTEKSALAAHQMMWETFEGSDGATHCRLRGDAPHRMRSVSKVWRSDSRTIREMERRRAGRLKGKFVENGEKKDAGTIPAGEGRVIENVE